MSELRKKPDIAFRATAVLVVALVGNGKIAAEEPPPIAKTREKAPVSLEALYSSARRIWKGMSFSGNDSWKNAKMGPVFRPLLFTDRKSGRIIEVGVRGEA